MYRSCPMAANRRFPRRAVWGRKMISIGRMIWRTGRAELTPHARQTADLIERMRQLIEKLAQEPASRGDLKILCRTLIELRYAFKVFTPYRTIRKVTVFGSARTRARGSRLSADGGLRPGDGRPRLDGSYRRGQRHHGGRPRGGWPRKFFGAEHSFALRAVRQSGNRRRPQAGVPEILFYPQTDVRQRKRRHVSAPRRLRHLGRGAGGALPCCRPANATWCRWCSWTSREGITGGNSWALCTAGCWGGE